jgi:parvulin-like peptidyl-prolyl isomerase
MLCLASLFAAPLSAEIIDQIAATVDNQVITTSEIGEALRVAAFLNGEKPDLSPAARRRMADRLIEQILVRREMELTRYPEPSAADIAAALNDAKSRFAGEAQFQQGLAEYKLTRPEVEDALRRQITLVRYIDLRFRPEVQVQENEVMQYYETVFLPEIRKKGIKPEPSFEDARAECEERLTTVLVDKRVDTWLADARGQARIAYDEDAFR